MLINTFIHVRGIGVKTERRMWQEGILTWDTLIENIEKIALPLELKEEIFYTINRSKKCLQNLRVDYFPKVLPRGEMWRCYPEFKENTAFIDIETDGTWGAHAITLIGVYSGKKYRYFMKEKNLLAARDELME